VEVPVEEYVAKRKTKQIQIQLRKQRNKRVVVTAVASVVFYW
jgi:hypothetical protein